MEISRRTLPALLAASLALTILQVTPAHARPKCLGKVATIVGTAGVDEIRGTKKDDVIVALGGDDFIQGKGGDDRICSGAGGDLVGPGPGRDRLSGGSGADVILYGSSKRPVEIDIAAGRATAEGTDTFTRIEHVAGSELPDVIAGDEFSNILFGEGGDDRIDGGDSIDIITGDEGDDFIVGGGGFDVMSYSFAPTAITADLEAGSATGEGTDTLVEVEALQGSAFADILKGDSGDNFLIGQGGDDMLEGGLGHDSAVYWFAEAPVTANLATGTATGDGNDTFVDLEGLFGSEGFDDTLTGDDAPNYLDGDAGHDLLNGGGGDDWLVPGPGDDRVEGGDGSFDVVDFYAIDPLTADLSTGTATGEGADTLATIEGLSGTVFNDILIGDAGVNYVLGWEGDDQIQAGAGDDFIDGGAGSDSVDAGDGADNCVSIEVTPISCEGASVVPDHPLLSYSIQAANFRNLRAPRQ